MNSVANKYFEIGKQKCFRYDRKGAEEAFREALSSEPNDPTVLGWLAITLALLGKNDNALEIIDQFDGKDTSEVNIARGIIADNRDGNKQEAIDQYSKAIDLNQNNGFVFAMRGLTYSEIKKKTEAFADIENAIRNNPSAYVYIISGVVKENFGNKEGALSSYGKAIELDPENPRVWYFRADLYKKMGNSSQALEDYNRAINLDPELKWAWANRASLKKVLGKYKEALNDYDKAIELDPKYVWAINKRGNLKFNHLNDNQGALVDYNKLIKLDPNIAEYWATRGSIYEEIEKYQFAIKDFDKAIEIDPNYKWAYLKRGLLKFFSLNDLQGALLDAHSILELDPQDINGYVLRGDIRKDLGEFQKAIDDYSAALRIDKNHTYALLARGYLFRKLGKNELALADNMRRYELEEKQANHLENPASQEVSNVVHQHFQHYSKPQIASNGEKFVEYWECILHWGSEVIQSIQKGTQSYAHHGRYGIGYICLSDSYLRIFSLGSLSKKYSKDLGFGFGKKILLAMFKNYDLRTAEKADKVWIIPFKDIQTVSSDNEEIRLNTALEKWHLSLLFEEEEYFLTALDLARKGNLRKMVNIDMLGAASQTTSNEEEIFEKLDRLGSLREKGILTKEEFEQKKKELLARI